MDRYVNEDKYSDAGMVVLEGITHPCLPSQVKEYADSYVQQMIIQLGAVEFTTIKDLEKVYEESE